MSKQTTITPKIRIQSIRVIVDNIRRCHNKFKTVSQNWSIEESIKKLEDGLKQLEDKCENIQRKINRKETKIFLFGTTSVGKSKIINVLLGRDLLVSAQAHSTCCFVHLKKSSSSDWIIKYKNSEEKCNIEQCQTKLKELTSCHDKDNKQILNFDESLECFVVCDKNNKIFKDNIEIVDCPGSANKQIISDCISKQSLDADLFIFVIKSVITDHDQMFFKYQSDQSTKPDIFILVNGCDNGDYDNEDVNSKSTENIKYECRKYLTKHYNYNEDIDKRIFFISAAEMFKFRQNRTNEKKTEKQEERYKEFERFENNIADYMTNITQNKFRRYGKEISLLDSDVENLFKIFSEDLRNIKCEYVLENYNKKKESLSLLSDKISENCNDFILTMENSLNKFKIVDVFNLEVVNNEIRHQYENLDKLILDFALNQEKEISSFVKIEELDVSLTYKWEKKMQPLKNGKTIDKLECDLKQFDNSTSKTVARILSFIPIASIFATNIALNIAEEAKRKNEKFKEEYDKKYIEELREKLVSIAQTVMKIIESNIEVIKKEMHSNIKNVEKKIGELKKLFQDYWKEINKLLQSFKISS